MVDTPTKWTIVVLSEAKELNKSGMNYRAFEVVFIPYGSATLFTVGRYETEAEARRAVAIYLKSHRRCGYLVGLIESGKEWHVDKLGNASFLPPECGYYT